MRSDTGCIASPTYVLIIDELLTDNLIADTSYGITSTDPLHVLDANYLEPRSPQRFLSHRLRTSLEHESLAFE